MQTWMTICIGDSIHGRDKVLGVDDNLYLHLYMRLTLGTGDRRLEKVPTLLKRVSAL